MQYDKKEWKDRITEYPNRRTLTNVSDSSVTTVQVSRNEGTVSQEGDPFSAETMNDLEDRIEAGFDSIANEDLAEMSSNIGQAVVNFSVSGTTVTCIRRNGTTFTFNTQYTNTTYRAFTGATSSSAGTTGLVPAPQASSYQKFLRGDGTWQTPTNTTYNSFTGATASAAGSSGLVPAPAQGRQNYLLSGAGTWVAPITVDSSLSTSSTNPVRNSVVTTEVNKKLNKTAFSLSGTTLTITNS